MSQPLRDKIKELQREIRLAEARHEREFEQAGEEHQNALLAAFDEIQRLKEELEKCSTKLVTKRTKSEAETELQEAYDENARLVEFIQQVADAPRTKFSSDARKLLGQ